MFELRKSTMIVNQVLSTVHCGNVYVKFRLIFHEYYSLFVGVELMIRNCWKWMYGDIYPRIFLWKNNLNFFSKQSSAPGKQLNVHHNEIEMKLKWKLHCFDDDALSLNLISVKTFTFIAYCFSIAFALNFNLLKLLLKCS